jgi:hypothetical protein
LQNKIRIYFEVKWILEHNQDVIILADVMWIVGEGHRNGTNKAIMTPIDPIKNPGSNPERSMKRLWNMKLKL